MFAQSHADAATRPLRQTDRSRVPKKASRAPPDARALGDDDTQIVESVVAGSESLARLEAKIAGIEVRIGCGNIGWVRYDHVEFLYTYPGIPISFDAMHVFGAETSRIVLRY
jgi:hypothetical protein